MIPSDKQYSDEAILLKKAIEWLESLKREGIKVVRINDNSHVGYSDLFISVNGWFVVAELKDNKGSASVPQKLFIKEMIATGAVGGVCRSLRDIYRLIQTAKAYPLSVVHPIDADGNTNNKVSYCYSCGTNVKNQLYCHVCGQRLKWT